MDGKPSIRPLSDKDVPSVVTIINERYKDSYEEIPFTEDSFLSYVQERKSTVLVAEDAGRVRGAIVFVVYPWGNCIDMLAAQKSSDYQRTEDLLVQELERLVKVEEIYTNLDEGSPEMQNWVRRGYAAEGGLYHMVAQLKGQALVPAVKGKAALRSIRSGEEEALVELVNKSFGYERLTINEVRDWKKVPEFTEEWVHVAEADGKLISVTASMLDQEYSEYFGRRRGYLGPAATLPEYKNKGLASALTKRATNFLASKGMESASLYVLETNAPSIKLAQKLGFSISHHWIHMRKRFGKQH